MKSSCVLCHTTHDAQNWKYAEYEKGKEGWFCERWFKPTNPEFVPQRIKDQRQEYAKSLLQPYRGGTASQEYIEAYGTGRIQPEDIKGAKNVWKEVLPSRWKNSK
jgi:hypothetical protein